MRDGNESIRRIVDYLILIDGNLQHIARATNRGASDITEERRRSAR